MPLVIYSLGGGHTYTGGMKMISRNQAFQDFKKPGLKIAVWLRETNKYH